VDAQRFPFIIPPIFHSSENHNVQNNNFACSLWVLNVAPFFLRRKGITGV
jgi:hypothetical protein